MLLADTARKTGRGTEIAPSGVVMSDRDFGRFRDMIYRQCGINLPPVKKTMLASRLSKRMRALDMNAYGAYYDYVAKEGACDGEMVQMLDAVSTNKTDFFRESAHFDFLQKKALPALVRSGRWRPGSKLNVWSAGCSSGQEPYTIAMVLAKFADENRVGDFSILATDISTRVLEIAVKGIYPEDVTAPVPEVFRRKYFMRGKGNRKGFCRVVPELRKQIQFCRLNLNGSGDFGIRTRMDIIFCRNVIIYFDRDTQRVLFNKFYHQLEPEGYLLIGHSESLHGINDHFKGVESATYIKPV